MRWRKIGRARRRRALDLERRRRDEQAAKVDVGRLIEATDPDPEANGHAC